MADNSRKVIGYCAFASPTEVICTGDQGEACVISGSVRAMKAFLKEIDPDGQKAHTVKKDAIRRNIERPWKGHSRFMRSGL